MKALEVLEQSVDRWDAIIIFLARNKLDFRSQHKWEEVVGQQEQDHIPTVEEFLKVLQERCRTFEMLNGKVKQKPTTQASTNKKSEKRVALAITSHVRFVKRSITFIIMKNS